MRKELQEYLDGELGFEALPEELRGEARSWERLLGDVRWVGDERAPIDLEERILAALPEARRPQGVRRATSWMIRPRTIRVSPLAGLAAAAVIALIVLLPRGERPSPAAGPEDGTTIYVQFSIEAPSANSVALAGDFNDWSPQIVLTDSDGDGVWTGRVALEPGVHQYMFVIDGTQWTTDPKADRYTDDGFGNRNAVLVIPEPAARS